MVNMGGLYQYPFDPFQQWHGTNNTLSIIGHEFGHRWMAFLDTADRLLLGRDQAHWSFFHNSYGSVMEGNEILDLGNGSFRTVGATYRYSPFDQYIMGLRAPTEVDPWFAVANPRFSSFPLGFPTGCRADLASCAPFVGADFTGTRRDVTIDEIISIAGPRIPSYPAAQKDFRVAFILLTQRGQTPSATSVAKVDGYRANWEAFFGNAVEGRGAMRTDMVYIPPPAVTEVSNTIAPNGSRRIETVGLDSTTRVGYASVDSAYGIAVFRSRDGVGIKSEAAVPAATAATTFLVFAERTATVSTGLAMVNPSAAQASVLITLSNGAQTALTLAAREQRARFVHELFPNIGSGFSGTMSIRSDVPIAVTALRGLLNELSEFIIASVPINSGSALYTDITTFPQIADGAGYSTELILINPASTRITGAIDFSFSVTSDKGTGTHFTYDIPAGDAWRMRTLNAAATVAVGFAAVIPDSGMTRPVSSAIFSRVSGGVLRFQAGVPAEAALTRAVMFGSRDGSQRSVLALANRGAQAATVTLTAFDQNGGAVVAGKVVTVPVNGHVAAFFDELIPELPAGFQGTVTMDASSQVHVITLRTLVTSSASFIMTTMPVINLASPPAGPSYFPQLADGGNFTTEFLLLNVGTSSFRLQFFGTDGQALPTVLR
jgi:hypothetical protein